MSLSPAKINLTLAITGRRLDGFHDLISLVAPVPSLIPSLFPPPAPTPSFVPIPPCRPDRKPGLEGRPAFRAATGWLQPVQMELLKNIPHGAGLGGGSGNAATALLLLNELAGFPLSLAGLFPLAASVGSDCPLFLHRVPGVMRGRGERFTPLPRASAARLQGLRVLLFKPSFPVSTPWAYQAFAALGPASLVSAETAEESLRRWENGLLPLPDLLHNSLQAVVFQKYLALPLLTREITETFGLPTLMSGSGSCCFALLRPETDAAELAAFVRSRWGATAWTAETSLL